MRLPGHFESKAAHWNRIIAIGVHFALRCDARVVGTARLTGAARAKLVEAECRALFDRRAADVRVGRTAARSENYEQSHRRAALTRVARFLF